MRKEAWGRPGTACLVSAQVLLVNKAVPPTGISQGSAQISWGDESIVKSSVADPAPVPTILARSRFGQIKDLLRIRPSTELLDTLNKIVSSFQTPPIKKFFKNICITFYQIRLFSWIKKICNWGHVPGVLKSQVQTLIRWKMVQYNKCHLKVYDYPNNNFLQSRDKEFRHCRLQTFPNFSLCVHTGRRQCRTRVMTWRVE